MPRKPLPPVTRIFSFMGASYKRSGSEASASAVLLAGGVVVIPTDTVYGLAAHPDFPAAVARLSKIKGRVVSKPIALLAADMAAVECYGAVVSRRARELAECFWPGALTLVLPCGEGYEGFRVPNHEKTRELLRDCGGILRVTSANLSGEMPAASAVAVLRSVGLEADLVVDGGVCGSGVASSVVKVERDGSVAILREGAVKIE